MSSASETTESIPGTDYRRCTSCGRVSTDRGQHRCREDSLEELPPLDRLNYLAGYPDEPPEETRKRFVPEDPESPVVHTRRTSGRTNYHRATRVSYLEGKGAVAEGIAPAFYPSESRSVVVLKMGLDEDEDAHVSEKSAFVPQCAYDDMAAGGAFVKADETIPGKHDNVSGITATMRKMADQRFDPCAKCWKIEKIAHALDNGNYGELIDINGWDAREALPADHPAWDEIIAPQESDHDFVNDSPEEIARRAYTRDEDPYRQYDTLLALYHRHGLSTDEIANLLADTNEDGDGPVRNTVYHGMNSVGITFRPACYHSMNPESRLEWARENLRPEEWNVIPFEELFGESDPDTDLVRDATLGGPVGAD